MLISDIHTLFTTCSEANTDTRSLVKDSMFFALKGPQFNANSFAQKALDQGCKYAVIDEEAYFIDDRTILVEDVLETLQSLSLYHRKQLNIPVIGITGSNGKTTTKELLLSVLKEKYNVYATAGNYNNHIGVPLTLLAIKPEVEIAIVEMGANHADEIAFLCDLCLPNYGLITNIGKAHLEGFGSFETIIETKTALYRFLKEDDGIAFVNEKDALLMELSENNKRALYRSSSTIDGEIINAKNPFLSFNFLDKGVATKNINTQLIGDYNLDNVLAAMAVGLYFAVPFNDIISGIEYYSPSNNRSQWLETGKNQLILDAYNANPSSTLLAIDNFNNLQVENKLVILGDMLELGESAKKEHQSIIDVLKNYDLDVFLVGPLYSSCSISDTMHAFVNTSECKIFITDHPIEDKTILIKGSRGLKLESLVDVL